jgi:glucuronoarabinoxylan endo-1,4-beta-xylanase
MILASALFAWGCGSSSPGSPGTGGSGTGTAGATGSAGSGQTGGTTGTGGTASGTGGSTSPGTGGNSSGSGGSSSGSGGSSSGSGGSGGSTAGDAGATGTGGSAGGQGGAGTGNGGRGGGTAGSTAGRGGNGTGGTAGSGTGGSGGSGTGGSGTGVTVNLGATHQTIQGFGINDNWGQQFSSTVADSLFTTTGSGIGLTILRTGMNPSGAFYNSFESTQISNFKSRAGTSAKVIGSVWSPPASCKDNNSIADGGHLKSTCYDSWSTTIANFAKSNGFYAMSIGNEPDFASCGTVDPCNGNYDTTLFTAQEMVTWVKMAGPKLQNMGIKVIAPEASEWLHNWSNVSAGPDVAGKNSSDPLKCGCFPNSTTACSSACMNGMGYDYGHWLAKDTAAWAAFDIMGVHEYDSQVAEPWPADVNGGKPNKEVWQTEMSGVKWWPEQGPSSDISNGVAVAGWIHSALTVGEASAWVYWWYQAYNTDDNEGLLLKSGTDTKRHYTLGNYSKFVRPSFVRVDATGAPAGVLISAFKGSGTALAIVAINKNSSAVSVPITISGGTAPTSVTPWVTSSSDSLASKTAVAVSGGSFTASLAATTVTTFVSQ